MHTILKSPIQAQLDSVTFWTYMAANAVIMLAFFVMAVTVLPVMGGWRLKTKVAAMTLATLIGLTHLQALVRLFVVTGSGVAYFVAVLIILQAVNVVVLTAFFFTDVRAYKRVAAAAERELTQGIAQAFRPFPPGP